MKKIINLIGSVLILIVITGLFLTVGIVAFIAGLMFSVMELSWVAAKETMLVFLKGTKNES